MNLNIKILCCTAAFCAISVHAQLNVTVSPPKVVGQKTLVEVTMTNNFPQKVESARALCFLLNEQGKIVGQSAKWVIGGAKDRPVLEPRNGTTFNFVFTAPQSLVATNLTARLTFIRLILAGGQLADPNTKIIIQPSKKN